MRNKKRNQARVNFKKEKEIYMTFRKNSLRKSKEEEEFKHAYGAYPTEKELRQFMPYFNYKKKVNKYDLYFKL